MKVKKLLLGLSSATLVVAPIAAVVSCGQNKNYGDLWHGSHRDIVVYAQSDNGQNSNYGSATRLEAPLDFLASASMGNALNSQMLGLFNKVKDGFDKYKEEKSKTTVDGKEVETVKIKADFNRTSHLEFALVKAVKLIFKDGTKETFDSDANDKNDAKSINGAGFQSALSGKVKKIEFKYRDDFNKHHWIQQLTGKKMDAFKVEDIWTAIKINSYLNERTRKTMLIKKFPNGEGNKIFNAINKLMSKVSDNKTRFQETKQTSPASFYEVSGTYKLTKDQFRTANKSNVIDEANKTFTLSFDGDQTNKAFKSFWKNIFMNNGGISVYSTGEIKRVIIKEEGRIKQWAKENGIDFDKFKETELYKSGAMQRDLTQEEKDHEVGGHYYVSLNAKKSFQVNQNLDYIDKRWLDLRNKKGEKITLNSMRYEFIQSSKLAPTIMNEAYFQGFNVKGTIKAISASELQKALSNQKQYGVMHQSGYTASSMIGDYSAFQLLPTFAVGDKLVNGVPTHKHQPKYVFFNNNYAKVVWGHTIKELYEKAPIGTLGKAPTWDFAETLFGGTGIQFLSSLMSSMNFYTTIKEMSMTSQESTTMVAPEGPITGKEVLDGTHGVRYIAHPPTTTTADDKLHTSLRDVNALRTLSPQGNYEVTTVTREEYAEQFVKAGLKAIDRYGAPSSKLTILKRNIKEALDKAGIPMNEKVTWELPIARSDTGPTRNPVYEQLRIFIDSLDPRLNMVAEMNPYTEDGVLHGSSEVVQKEFKTDFSLSKESGGTRKWIKRLFAAGIGYTISSIKLAHPYKVSSPASPLLQNINYLQSGELLGLSYYSENKCSRILGTKLEGLKTVIEVLKDEMKKEFIINSADTWKELQSTDKQLIIDTLKNWKFENIYKAGAADMSSYDYIGLGGLEAIRKLKQSVGAIDKSNSKLVDDIALVVNKIGEWFENSLFALDTEMTSTMSQSEIMKALIAFNIIQPAGFNPSASMLGNRDVAANGLCKNWYHDPLSDSSGFDDISWIRVDTD